MRPLIVLTGPTASGKTTLALALAQHFQAEILACDSLTVYRHMNLGTAKPTPAERRLIPHHLLDLYDPPQPCTAGDWARHARTTLSALTSLPIIAGGTGLYLRALLDGLFPTPEIPPTLRPLLRHRAATRTGPHLHRTLSRFDPRAAALIHPNDSPKLIRAIEVSQSQPITDQWTAGRDALTGYRILRLNLSPPRAELYTRIDLRARAMFHSGLIEETRTLIQTFGPHCRPFQALGYKQAAAVLAGTLTEPEAITLAQQGHRNYAKRQLTWFRRESQLHPTQTLPYPGDDPRTLPLALALINAFLA